MYRPTDNIYAKVFWWIRIYLQEHYVEERGYKIFISSYRA